MAKPRHHPDQGDLFATPQGHYFPVRTPTDLPPSLDLKRSFATAMGAAIKASGKTANEIAVEMTLILANDTVTTAQLNAYTAESRTTHTISIVRWIAFVRATRQAWLWDFILRHEGLMVLEGEEALLAEIALAEQQAAQLQAKAKALRSRAPFEAKFRKARGGA